MAKHKRNKPRRSSKQKSRQQQVAPASSPAVADPLSALREAIAEVRGRRAIALLERLKTVDGLAESERLRLTALAREAQARELIANGHPREAYDAVRAAAKRQPELAPFWSLSLKVRCELEPDVEHRLKDPDWVAQLRLELVEPGDLRQVSEGGLDTQTAALIEAWRLAEAGQTIAANDQLKAIGRRSPLVDWRLFVQLLKAAQDGDFDQARTVHARMLQGSCAHRLATGMLEEARAQAASESPPATHPSPGNDAPSAQRQDASLREVLGRADPVALLRELAAHVRTVDIAAAQPRMLQDARRLHSMGRVHLATGVLAAFMESLPHAKRGNFVRHIKSRFPEPWRVLMRMGCNGKPVIAQTEIELALKNPTLWTPQERAVILLEAAIDLRKEAESDQLYGSSATRSILNRILGSNIYDDEDDAFDDDFDDDFEDGFADDLKEIHVLARAAASAWPELTDSYEVWAWADQQQNPDSRQALEARVQALPDRPDAWEALATFAAERGHATVFEQANARLGTFPGMTQRCETLQQQFDYSVIVAAFEAGDLQAVQTQAATLASQNPFHRVTVGVMDWMTRTDRKSKQAAGMRLADLGHPWLVMLMVFDMRSGTSPTSLPAPIRNALKDPAVHASVLSDFSLAVRERGRVPRLRKDLLRALANAFGAESAPLSAATEAAFIMVQQGWVLRQRNENQILLTDGLIALSVRLMCAPDPDAQAQALILRAVLLEQLCEYGYMDNNAIETQRSLLAGASLLAASFQTRTLLRKAIDVCGLGNDIEDAVEDMEQTTLDTLIANQRVPMSSIAEIVACMAPPQRRTGSAPPARATRGQPQRRSSLPNPDPSPSPTWPPPPPPPEPIFNAFNIDRFFPTTTLEFEMGIETARRMPPNQRNATLARLREMLETCPTLTENSKNRLLGVCDQAQAKPESQTP